MWQGKGGKENGQKFCERDGRHNSNGIRQGDEVRRCRKYEDGVDDGNKEKEHAQNNAGRRRKTKEGTRRQSLSNAAHAGKRRKQRPTGG